MRGMKRMQALTLLYSVNLHTLLSSRGRTFFTQMALSATLALASTPNSTPSTDKEPETGMPESLMFCTSSTPSVNKQALFFLALVRKAISMLA